MKKNPEKKPTRSALYPPPLMMKKSEKKELVAIPYTTGEKRTVSVGEIADGLNQLTERAAQPFGETLDGDQAREELFEIVTKTVARMNQQARKNPELWRGIAQRRGVWPINYNPTPMATRHRTDTLNAIDAFKFAVPSVHSKSQLDFVENPTQNYPRQVIAKIFEAIKAGHLHKDWLPDDPKDWRHKAQALNHALPLPTDSAVDKKKKIVRWRKVAEAVLEEARQNPKDWGPPASEKSDARYRKDYSSRKFWEMFEQQLLDAGKTLAKAQAAHQLTP